MNYQMNKLTDCFLNCVPADKMRECRVEYKYFFCLFFCRKIILSAEGYYQQQPTSKVKRSTLKVVSIKSFDQSQALIPIQ